MAEPYIEVSLNGDEPSDEPEDDEQSLGQAPGTVLPGEPGAEIHLDESDRNQLAMDLRQILDAHDTSMRPRIERWIEITDAYNLVPDSERQGLRPGAAQLVSEMTRSQVNIGTSRIASGILQMRPYLEVLVADDQSADPETQELLAEGKSIETFFDSYLPSEVKFDRKIPQIIHRTGKLGGCPVRVLWKKKTFEYSYLAKNGEMKTVSEDTGGIVWDLISPDRMIAWPLTETETDSLEIVGHRSYMTPLQFAAFCVKKGVDSSTVGAIADSSDDELTGKSIEDAEFKGRDIAKPETPKGRIQITELWCNWPLPSDDDPSSFQLFLHEPTNKVLWIGTNPIRCARHPYFRIPYWIEDSCFWPSGIGHELVYEQAADSALLNLLVDNLKLVANWLIVLKAGSQAEALRDQISPGYNLATEDPQADVQSVQLGGELTQIYQAMQEFDRRKTLNTGLTWPLQGMGDPTMKSGGSATALSQLIEQAGTKFQMVDNGIREELSAMFAYTLQLFQQYAPDEVVYDVLGEENEALFQRAKFRVPRGDLRRIFRIQARAPSAASNREILKQHLLVLYRQATEHSQQILQLAQLASPENQPRIQRLAEECMVFLNKLFIASIEENDVPGVKPFAPNVEKTPMDELLGQAFQQIEQLQAAMQEMQAQEQPQQLQEGPPAPAGAPGGGGAPF